MAGLRYDRPAVPEAYIDRRSCPRHRRAVKTKKNRPGAEPVRDILAVFDAAADGTTEYQVVAVVPSAASDTDADLVDNARQWLTDVALPVRSPRAWE